MMPAAFCLHPECLHKLDFPFCSVKLSVKRRNFMWTIYLSYVFRNYRMILVFLIWKKKFSKPPQIMKLSWGTGNFCSYFCFAVWDFLMTGIYISVNCLYLLKIEGPEVCFICQIQPIKARVKQSPWKMSGYMPSVSKVRHVRKRVINHCVFRRWSLQYLLFNASFWFASKEAPWWDKYCNHSDNVLGAAASTSGTQPREQTSC